MQELVGFAIELAEEIKKIREEWLQFEAWVVGHDVLTEDRVKVSEEFQANLARLRALSTKAALEIEERVKAAKK